MKQRYLSLDFLRGLTIFGMVFCAIIPAGVLPGWMYHVQNPPPTHQLNMTVAGIGWVDLVFPIFIFCMGVAIPLAGRGKLEVFGSGAATTGFTKRFVVDTLERFVMLWLFSYLYVFLNFSANTVNGMAVAGVWPQLGTILGFALLFPIYMVIKNKTTSIKWIRIGGVLAACGLMAVGHFCWGEVIHVQRRGIIIFLLAFLYLFGAFIWYFTMNKIKARCIVFGVILLFTLVTQYAGWPVKAYANPSLRWWFNVEYIYFLLLLLPATYVGDVLYKKISGGCDIYRSLSDKAMHWVFPLMVVLAVWLCYAFYMRLYWWNLGVSGVILIALWYGINRKLPQYREMFIMAAGLLLCGLFFEPLMGGIKKVPCTIQYCFATCGISILLLMVSDYVCKYIPKSLLVNTFTGAGCNPLMSYIAFDSLIVPFMKLTGFITLYQAAYPDGMPVLGILRGAVAVLFTMWVVSVFTKKKIFWKA
ncbi:MAG: DUF5009 domain-containing protein [Bacteroidales bacterium]